MPGSAGTYAHTRSEAAVETLARVLGSYGVLTGEWLRELSGARFWRGPSFDAVLEEALRAGRIRRLGDGLYELDESRPT